MKTQLQLALPLLLLALGATSARAQLGVSASADCPLEAFDIPDPRFPGSSLVDSAPLPVVNVVVTNGATPQTGVVVTFPMPTDTFFAAFLAPAPANVEYFDGSNWTSTLPSVEPTALRVNLGNMAASASTSFGVILRSAAAAGTVTSYQIATTSNEDPGGIQTSGHLRADGCPARVYVVNCLQATATACTGLYAGIEGRTFTLAGVGVPPASAQTSTLPTDQDGIALMPRLVDLDYLNDLNGDTANDGYPLVGARYDISHTLPADALPNGPFWTHTTSGTVTYTVLPTRSEQQIDFVDNASCNDVTCQTPNLVLTTDGAGLCEYDPLVVGGECTIDDWCLTNFRCENGACVGDPITCEDPGVCQSVGSGYCDQTTGQCAYEPVDCATETFTFFGVVDNGDGTLSSFECQINDAVGQVLCRVAGGGFAATGELLLGGPQCVSTEPPPPNYPPFLQVAYYGAEVSVQSELQLVGRDPESVQIQWAASNLPNGWTLSPTGLLTVPATAALGDYTIAVTLSDGTNPPVAGTITVRVLVAKYVFATYVGGTPSVPTGMFAADFASQGTGTAIQNADAICQQQASQLGTPDIQSRTFVAWLSAGSIDAGSRIADALYKMPNGTVVVRGKPSLFGTDDGTPGLENGIQIMADGDPLPWAVRAWTGTSVVGEATGVDCGGWSTTASASVATVGVGGRNLPNGSAATDYRWTRQSDSSSCDRTGILFCFEP